LHGALKHKALKGAEIHTECEIVGIDTSTSCPSVTLDDGRVFAGDLLIGADGLHV
jgi:salicylate hydroxylase